MSKSQDWRHSEYRVQPIFYEVFCSNDWETVLGIPRDTHLVICCSALCIAQG